MKNQNLATENVSRLSFNTRRGLKKFSPRIILTAASFFLILFGIINLSLPLQMLVGDKILPESFSIVSTVEANGTYYNFTGGSLTLNVNPATADLISSNDNWNAVSSIEGFCGNNLTETHGVDPQTVITSEFAALPNSANTCVTANKGNPSAFNAGGIAEFDRGGYLAIGFQGNVQNNPYLVFYLNTLGQSNARISYELTDIDSGSNSSVSPIALQYRVGETGNFTNIPEGFVADVTDGPNIAGRKTLRNVLLPAAAQNQQVVQVRLITTNAAATDGTSTPDEWIGINNVIVTNQSPTAAPVTIGGRATTASGNPIANIRITMTDSAGNFRTTATDSTGYYFFDNVSAGENCVLTVSSKRFVFAQPILFWTANSDYDEMNFVAERTAKTAGKNITLR